MSIIVNVPAPLRNLTNGEHKINANGSNIKEIIKQLYLLNLRIKIYRVNLEQELELLEMENGTLNGKTGIP